MISEAEKRINSITNEKAMNLIARFDRTYGSDESEWSEDVEAQFQEEWGKIEAEHDAMRGAEE